MSERRFAWQVNTALGVGLIAALVAPIYLVTLHPATVWQRAIEKGGHGAVFMGIGAVLALMQRPSGAAGGRSVGQLLGAWAMAIALGALTELTELLGVGRDPSVLDVARDATGAALGLALLAIVERWRSTTHTRGVTIVGRTGLGAPLVALLAAVLLGLQPLHALTVYAHRAAAFPSIAQFHGALDLALVETEGTRAAIRPLPQPWSNGPEDRALRLGYDAGHAAAVQVLEPSPDWRGYSTLAIDLTNPTPSELRLILRIFDRRHDWRSEDRLNLPLVIPPGVRRTVRVPLTAVETAPVGRRLDLAHIANVMLFQQVPTGVGELYVSRIWLQ
ncbi:MAG TPA: hypothetical protein VMT50_00945 [Steroidobacteraceae bacterium]|nr:hypothetical protein [Steroidobacteraceae bacterium]